MPPASLHVAVALLDGELHGYALMTRVAELSGGAVRMGPGTVYGTINRLVADGLIEESTDLVTRDDGDRRRYYRLTSAGRATAVEEVARLQRMVDQVARHLPGPATA